MYGRFLLVLLLALGPVLSEVTWQPFSGQLTGHVQIQAVDIRDVPNSGRQVTVTYNAIGAAQIVWHVNGKAVMNYDTDFLTISRQNLATLHVMRVDTTMSVMATIILPLYQESVYIQAGEAAPGRYTISNHTLLVTPKEAVTYAREDIGNFHVDAALWVGDESMARNLRLHSMVLIPDYTGRPVRPLVGVSSSLPTLIESTRPHDDDNFLGRSDWADALSPGQRAANRVHIVSVQQPKGARGMLAISSTFSPTNSPIKSVHTVQRAFFKPAVANMESIQGNTVTFFGWQKDVLVDQHEDVDLHVYAIGNPTPRIMLAKNGADVGMGVGRLDIEEAYYKHTIFRFRNVTVATSGRYICTAESGSGRLKQTFTLYVRSC
ncbi:uncharacterized protein [Haliotis asinina]|uniref:uncharacterized protein n=1 Tax=Haliotis asinina TaxID=109174 RepID=UPI003531BC33